MSSKIPPLQTDHVTWVIFFKFSFICLKDKVWGNLSEWGTLLYFFQIYDYMVQIAYSNVIWFLRILIPTKVYVYPYGLYTV